MSDSMDTSKIEAAKEVYDEEGVLWKVEQVLKPTDHDCYIVCSRVHEGLTYDDGTRPIYMYAFDINHDELYFASQENKKLFERKRLLQETINDIRPYSYWQSAWDDEE
jgi:hypothetical protein